MGCTMSRHPSETERKCGITKPWPRFCITKWPVEWRITSPHAKHKGGIIVPVTENTDHSGTSPTCRIVDPFAKYHSETCLTCRIVNPYAKHNSGTSLTCRIINPYAKRRVSLSEPPAKRQAVNSSPDSRPKGRLSQETEDSGILGPRAMGPQRDSKLGRMDFGFD
jgi:hypothetical protein